MLTENPSWINFIFCGFEGEGDGGAGGGNGGIESDDGASGDGDKGKGGTGDGGTDPGEDVTGLKSALEKERENVKSRDKEMAKLRKRLDEFEGRDKSEVDRAKDVAGKATDKVGKLATKLRENSVNHAIVTALSGRDMPKFADVDDVLTMLNRSGITVEQDEDDPSDVTVDRKTVEAAIKDLAKKKSHLLVAEGDTEPSGGKFGGGGGKDPKKLDEKTAEQRYPALRT